MLVLVQYILPPEIEETISPYDRDTVHTQCGLAFCEFAFGFDSATWFGPSVHTRIRLMNLGANNTVLVALCGTRLANRMSKSHSSKISTIGNVPAASTAEGVREGLRAAEAASAGTCSEVS